jgi:exodeoxyribonuclease III
MKIATLNINNVNKRLPNLLGWLRATKPDIVCLQELKAADAEFPADALRGAGYEAAWRGEKTWNGVAILARGAEPIVTRTELPGDPGDRQSRYIEAAVNGTLIASLYAPNGNPQPGPKFEYKLAWLERLAAHAAELYGAGVPVVLAGDFNVVPTDRDIYRPSRGRRTRWCSQKAAPRFGVCSSRAGSMRCAPCIRKRRCTRSGTTCETAGSVTPACASISCC